MARSRRIRLARGLPWGWALLAACLLALGAPGGLAAQAPAPGEQALPPQLSFRHLTVEQGLSDNLVRALLQDRAGFIWVGTLNGLNRYDGYEFVTYRHDPADPSSLPNNTILALYEGRAGTLWVGTAEGLAAYEPRSDRFTRYRHDPDDPHSLSAPFVLSVYEDRSGTLWVGTEGGGLNRFDPGAEGFTVYRNDPANPHSLSNDVVSTILEDRAGNLWVGTDGGLNRLDRATGRFDSYRHTPEDPRSLSHDNVNVLYEDRAGVLWVGTWGGGLNRFDPGNGSFFAYRAGDDGATGLGDDRIAALLEDGRGALWIGSFSGGVAVLDPERRHVRIYRNDSSRPDSLSHDRALALLKDRSGLIWVGTEGRGVNLFDPQQLAFTHYQHARDDPGSLATGPVLASYEDAAGNLWLGMQNAGLDRLDRRSEQVAHYAPDSGNPQALGFPTIFDIHADRAGMLWLSSFGGGLYCLDPATDQFKAYHHRPDDPMSLSNNNVTQTDQDATGALWVATVGGGVNRLDPATGRFTRYRHRAGDPQSLSSDSGDAILVDRGGMVWFGTRGSGLNRIDPATGRATRFRNDPADLTSLSDDFVFRLLEDRAGTIWVGTWGGLNRFEPATESFVRYDSPVLTQDRIMGLIEEGSASAEVPGDLVVVLSRTLVKLDRTSGALQVIDASNGLPAVDFTRGTSLGAAGELYLPTQSGGLVVADPALLPFDPEPPPVVFTGLQLNNAPAAIGAGAPLKAAIDATDAVTLTHTDHVVALEFAALSYRAPEQNRFRYTLEGFSDGWIEVDSSRRQATFTNLDPGRYVFRVTGSNADGVWNETGRAIALTVLPPWWETLWFRGLVVALVAGAVLGAFRWRVRLVERQRAALEVEVAERRQVEHALRASEESLRQSNAQIQQLAGGLITAQEEERRRIARELHDDVSQQIAALAIGLSALKGRLGAEGEAAHEQLSRLQQRTAGLSDEVRALSHRLHPAALEHAGLVAALRGYSDELSVQSGVAVELQVADGVEPLPQATAIGLYRIAQEALRNVARHAGATVATVALAPDGAGLVLRVSDNGRGFDVGQARRQHSLGLTSIEERARLLGGSLELHIVAGRQGQIYTPADFALAHTIGSALANVIANLRLLATEQRQRQIAESLCEVATVITSSLDLETVLGTIFEQLRRVVRYDGAALFVPEGDELMIAMAVGGGVCWVGHAINQQARDPAAAVFRQLRPRLIADTATAEDWDEWSEPGEVRSWMGVPLVLGTTAIGVLTTDHPEVALYRPADLRVLEAFGHQAAIAIGNARRYRQAQQAAAEEERRRLARELHDSVSQALFSANLVAEVLPQLWARDEERGRLALAELQGLTRGAQAEMRTMLLELRPAALTQAPLHELLGQLATAAGAKLGCEPELRLDPAPVLPEQVQLALYRIGQEALNNSVRHARPCQLEVRLAITPPRDERAASVWRGTVALTLADSGCGFDLASMRTGRLGLSSLRERADAIGARLQLESAPGAGTRICVSWSAPQGGEE